MIRRIVVRHLLISYVRCILGVRGYASVNI